ncbi:hypothetical protein [Embleya sp. NPDC005971]|uniref:hypothetical protein n=1 Tax=Embleya sp. NPDC005971 TaxID=3156724 RepID=UPI0033E5F838
MRIRALLAAAAFASAALSTMAGSAHADTDVAILSGFNDNPCITIDTDNGPDEAVSTTIRGAYCG